MFRPRSADCHTLPCSKNKNVHIWNNYNNWICACVCVCVSWREGVVGVGEGEGRGQLKFAAYLNCQLIQFNAGALVAQWVKHWPTDLPNRV